MTTSNTAQKRYERDMKWREMYEKGMTLQQISEQTGGDYLGTISRAIQRVGGTMRPTGYRPGDKDKNKPKKGLMAWLNS